MQNIKHLLNKSCNYINIYYLWYSAYLILLKKSKIIKDNYKTLYM